MKRYFPFVLLIIFGILVSLYFFTYGDSEWRDNQVMDRVTNINETLASYKKIIINFHNN